MMFRKTTDTDGAAKPRRYRVGRIGFSLQAGRWPAVHEFLDLYHGCRRANMPDGEPEIEIEVRQCSGRLPGRPRFAVYGDGVQIFSNRKATELVPCIEWGINRRVIESRTEFVQVHAAVLARRGEGVLLAGTSGAGKSTLAAGLLARGWSYLSDEFALLDPRTLAVWAFPKALCIKSGSFEVVERLGLPLRRSAHYASVFKGEVGYVSPSDLPRRQLSSVPAIRTVLFPHYDGRATPATVRVSPARGAYLLATHTFNRHLFGGRALDALARVTRNADCYRLVSADLDATCEVVEALVSAESADSSKLVTETPVEMHMKVVK